MTGPSHFRVSGFSTQTAALRRQSGSKSTGFSTNMAISLHSPTSVKALSLSQIHHTNITQSNTTIEGCSTSLTESTTILFTMRAFSTGLSAPIFAEERGRTAGVISV
jgi:hypothetical protein